MEGVREYSVLGVFSFFVLLACVLGSVFAVVVTSFETRRHLAELESLRAEARAMQVLWGQYLVEKSTWASYSRIHGLAVGQLNMQVPKPGELTVVNVE